MASRYEIELKVTSAKDLKNVNWRHGPIKPYAVIWVEPDRKVASRVDEEGDTCPHWDQTLVIPFDRPIEDATLHLDIVHAHAAEDTKPLIGSAKLHLRDVIDDVGIGARATRQLQLKRPSGRPHGKVDVQVSIRDTRYRAQDPYYAPAYGVREAPSYPAPYSGASAPPPPYAASPAGYPYGQPPQPTGYGYGQPAGYGYGSAIPQTAQPAGYGYGSAIPQTAQPAGYGYGSAIPQVAQQPAGYGYGSGQGIEEKKKSKFGGMGMGTGLAVGAVAGALGGLALAEGFDKLEDHIADEAAERVEDDLATGNDDYYDDGGDGDW